VRVLAGDNRTYARGVILTLGSFVPWWIVAHATGDALLAFLAYVLPAGGIETAFILARRRYWPVDSMVVWLGAVTSRFEAARTARLAAPEAATAEELRFDLARAAALNPDKPGDADMAAYHAAALKLPDAEMRYYEIASAGFTLAFIAQQRGYDFMPYLVRAAGEVSNIHLRARQQILLWLLRWRHLVALILIGLVLGLGVAMGGHV
jgi:hypothetical protein